MMPNIIGVQLHDYQAAFIQFNSMNAIDINKLRSKFYK